MSGLVRLLTRWRRPHSSITFASIDAPMLSPIMAGTSAASCSPTKRCVCGFGPPATPPMPPAPPLPPLSPGMQYVHPGRDTLQAAVDADDFEAAGELQELVDELTEELERMEG